MRDRLGGHNLVLLVREATVAVLDRVLDLLSWGNGRSGNCEGRDCRGCWEFLRAFWDCSKNGSVRGSRRDVNVLREVFWSAVRCVVAFRILYVRDVEYS